MSSAPKSAINVASSQPECCMCGDFGLSYELFRCKVCHFRSQHRYCSNLYPKADPYQVCNWCLSSEPKEKSQNSSNSSSSNKNSSEDDSSKSMKKGLKNQRGGSLQLQVINSPIKKQKSPERSRVTTRRRLVTAAQLEEKKLIRRTKSEELSNTNNNNNNTDKNNNNGMMIKPVFRNRVRRYKLLDEVSS